MSDDAPTRQLLLKEADRFLELEIDYTNVATEPVVETVVATETITEAVVEFLPVVVPVEAPVDVVPVENPNDLGFIGEDSYVPEEIEQRLIYQWLMYGPDWRADIVTAPPPVDNTIPPEVIDPQRFPRPRNIGFYDDGTRRKILLRE